MLILMKQGASRDQIATVCDRVRDAGFTPHEIPGAMRTAAGITGNQGPVSPELFQHLGGVAECVAVSKPYKLVSRETKPENTVIDVRGARIGDGSMQLIAGPCSVESRDQIMTTAEAVARSGAKFLRGGVGGLGSCRPRGPSRAAAPSFCAAGRSSRARARTCSRA